MERLTKKLECGLYECIDEIMTFEGGIRQTQILGKLEDIEEKHNMSIDEMDAYITEHKKIEQELGIELSVLFKAMTKGFYYKITAVDGTITDYVSKVELWQVNWQMFNDRFTIFADTYYLKDYGKTWALDRKELEK